MYPNDYTIKLRARRTLGYTEYGDPKGKPVFFFHGWPSCRLHAENIADAAKKVGARIISPDRPGIGLSDFKPNRSLLDYPNDVVELADQLKIKKFAVVGVSGGGPYAAVCAYKIPDRLTKVGIVVGLAPTYRKGILEGMALGAKLGWISYRDFPIIRYLSSLWMLMLGRYLPMLIALGFSAKQDKKLISKEMKAGMIIKRKEAFRQGIRGQALDLKIYTNNWGFDLNKIKAKVHLWYGERDKNVSLAMARYYKQQISNSKLTIYPNEGHLCQITHSEEIYKTLVS